MKLANVQGNMTSGELSPDMFTRIDSGIFEQGLSKAQNVIIMPHGGVRRRPGLTKTKDSILPSTGKMFSFEFSSNQDYLLVLVPFRLQVYKDGVLVEALAVPYSESEIPDVDAAQSGDIMIMTHQKHKPKLIRREGSSTNWTVRDIPFKYIPKYNFTGIDDPKYLEPVWSTKRGWPGTCTFFQQRLWFAGSTQKPNSVWGSKINGIYDFDVGSGQPDYGIFDTIDSDQFNNIVNIYPGRNLMIFTSGSEFYNTADFITSESSNYKRSTSYGSKRLRPVMIDGAVYFADRIGVAIRESIFQFQENAYVAPSISIFSDHLIKDVKSMDAVKGTNIDVSDFLYVVNVDGTVAVMNSSRLSKMQGWTQWTTEGKFKDVCVVNKVVYFIVERHGEHHIEYMNEGTTLDHNTVVLGTPRITKNVIHSVNNVSFGGRNVVYGVPGSGTSITSINTKETPAQAAQLHKVILDNSMMPDQLGGNITLPRPAYHVEVGFDVPLKVSTMPLNVGLQNGPTINKVKRVIKAELNLRDTLGVYANQKKSPDREFTVVLDKAPKLFTGLKEVYLLGYEKEVILEITQKNPLPFKMLGLGYTQEIT